MLFLLIACSGDTKESVENTGTTGVDSEQTTDSGDTSDTSDTGDTGDTSDTGTAQPIHVSISAVVTVFTPDRAFASEGSCVQVLDPSKGINGGTPDVLGSTTVGANGIFTVSNITLSEYPPLILVDDCHADPPVLFPTATPVPTPMMENLKDGDSITDVQLAVLPAESVDAITASLTAVGDSTDITKDGVMLGFVWDQNRNGIPQATISCQGCKVYYQDGDPTDGFYSTQGKPNPSTDPSGLWVIPGAAIGDYTAVANGYQFPTWKAGAIPSGAMIMVFVAK